MNTSHTFRTFFKRMWNSFCKYFNPDDRLRILEILSEEYIEKTENVVKLTDYAARMVYPQFRDNLLRIAADEQGFIRWVAEHITALGGEVPQPCFSPKTGKNAWERLLTVLEKKKRHGSDRIDRLLQLDRINPAIAQELRRVRQEEELHQREIQDMMMRSDPQAGWHSEKFWTASHDLQLRK